MPPVPGDPVGDGSKAGSGDGATVIDAGAGPSARMSLRGDGAPAAPALSSGPGAGTGFRSTASSGGAGRRVTSSGTGAGGVSTGTLPRMTSNSSIAIWIVQASAPLTSFESVLDKLVIGTAPLRRGDHAIRRPARQAGRAALDWLPGTNRRIGWS
jgi:hypothetical protein